MAHPTEAELRELGQEILDLLALKTAEEGGSLGRAAQNAGIAQNDPLMAEKVESYVRDVYKFLPDMFAQFAEPRPDDFEQAIIQCAKTSMILKPSFEVFDDRSLRVPDAWGVAMELISEYPTSVTERVSAVEGQVEDWSGRAAQAFTLHYMNEFPDAIKFQQQVAFTLACTLEANQEIFKRVGRDIRQIGEKTKEALRHVTDRDPTGIIVVLTVVAAVATVASAGAASGAAAVLFATVAASGSVAAAAVSATESAEPQERQIEGATTQEIMVSMMDCITELQKSIRDAEDVIVRCLNVVTEAVQQMRGELELTLHEDYTSLAGASPYDIRDNFRHT